MSESKCEMARLRYCRKSSMGYCNAEDRDLETCPYLKVIGEIARLAVENSKYEDNQKKLKTWISDYKQRDGFDMVLLKEVVDILEEFVVDV
jgi:hypothetical protein